jgi:hypothetical protein
MARSAKICREVKVCPRAFSPTSENVECPLFVLGDRESLLSDWPFDRPVDWVECVNAAQTEGEIEALRKCVNRGTPYGTEAWKTQIAATLGLKSTLHPRGRPRKQLELTNTQT